jgi:hypothetical protein
MMAAIGIVCGTQGLVCVHGVALHTREEHAHGNVSRVTTRLPLPRNARKKSAKHVRTQ